MTYRDRPATAPAFLLALILALALPAAGATAQTCPDAVLDTEREGDLFAALAAAPDAHAAKSLNAQLWALWTDAPDAHAQGLLDKGMARLRVGDLGKALSAFDALVAYCPGYAEGYNQRAFAYYLRKEFTPALADLDVALRHSPRHVGALSGKALTLMGLGRDREALDALNDALALNPWLSERSLVPVLTERLGAREL